MQRRQFGRTAQLDRRELRLAGHCVESLLVSLSGNVDGLLLQRHVVGLGDVHNFECLEQLVLLYADHMSQDLVDERKVNIKVSINFDEAINHCCHICIKQLQQLLRLSNIQRFQKSFLCLVLIVGRPKVFLASCR